VTILVGASAVAAELRPPPPEIELAASTRDATTTMRTSPLRDTGLSVGRSANPQVGHSAPERVASVHGAEYGYDDAENLLRVSSRRDTYRFAPRAAGLSGPVRFRPPAGATG
jgi:hypothetical protein